MNTPSLSAVSLLFVSTLSAQSILLDFGRTDLQSGPNWNNVVPATTTLFALVDSTGVIVPGGAGFEITDTFFQTGEPSQLGTESPLGDAALYPVEATDDYFFGHTTPFAGADANPLGQFKLFNLDTTATYDFSFFASRMGVSDNRETRYAVAGASSESVLLDPSNNESEVVRVLGISPNGANEIVIDVTPGPNNDNGNGFYYLGLVQVDIHSSDPVIPEPSAIGLMSFAVVGLLALRRRRSR